MADKPKLRGPASPQKRTVQVNTGRCRHRCLPSRIKRYSIRKSYVHRRLQQIIIIVQAPETKPQKTKPQILPDAQHKTIYINTKTKTTIPKAKPRNQILSELRKKAQS